MLRVEVLVLGLIEGDLAHELAEIVASVLDPLQARVGLVETRIRLVQPLAQLQDAVSDTIQYFGCQIGSHEFRISSRRLGTRKSRL